jgi:hypothetical protein
MVRADWLEPLVWARVRDFAMRPEAALAEAQAQLRATLADAAAADAERHALLTEAARLDRAREDVLTLVRRGMTTMAEAERHLAANAAEQDALRARARRLADRAAVAAAWEAGQTSAFAAAARLRAGLAEAEADPRKRAAYIRHLVREIVVETRDEGRRKAVTATIHYAVGSPDVVEVQPTRS